MQVPFRAKQPAVRLNPFRAVVVPEPAILRVWIVVDEIFAVLAKRFEVLAFVAKKELVVALSATNVDEA